MTVMQGDRYFALDGMRGIAAILVVLYHCAEILPSAAPGGHAAVDFFFALSGFVIARAYHDRLERGLSPWRFMEMRLVRLYPLYIGGTMLGAAKYLLAIGLHLPEAKPASTLLLMTLSGILMLPAPVSDNLLFPLNGPAWSLFFEMAINLAFALTLVRRSNRLLVAIVLLAGLTIVWRGIANGDLNLGWNWRTFEGGAARVTYAFLLGILLHRALGDRAKRPSWWALAPPAMLAFVILVNFDPRFRLAFDTGVMLFGTPLILLGGILLEVPGRLRRIAAWLGDISYPLYTLHAPIFSICTTAVERFYAPPLLVVPIYIAFMLLLSHAMLRFYDAPVRALINARLRLRRSAPVQAI